MRKVLALPVLLFATSGVALDDRPLSSEGPSESRARVIVAAIAASRAACDYYCGTEERCSTGQHDMFTIGGGIKMTGDFFTAAKRVAVQQMATMVDWIIR